jgi:hypothetical protein
MQFTCKRKEQIDYEKMTLMYKPMSRDLHPPQWHLAPTKRNPATHLAINQSLDPNTRINM